MGLGLGLGFPNRNPNPNQLYTHVLGEGALRGAPPPLAWPTIANFNQLMKVFGLGLGLGVGVGLGLGLGLTLTLS